MRRLFLLSVILLFLFPFLTAEGEKRSSLPSSRANEVLNKADWVAHQARFERRTEKKLRRAIELYQKALHLGAEGTHPLNRLSLGYFMLAETFLKGGEGKEVAYKQGLKYGLRSLRKCPAFERSYRKKGKAALRDLPRSCTDPKALFGTAANLGRLTERKGILDSLGNLPLLFSLFRRVLRINEGYMGGVPHRVLGALGARILGDLPLTFWQVHRYNLSWSKVNRHFKRAIELAPNCLENYFFYAKYFALRRGKKKPARRLLKRTLEGSLGEKYPLVNMVAKREARKLYEEEF